MKTVKTTLLVLAYIIVVGIIFLIGAFWGIYTLVDMSPFYELLGV